MPTVPYPDDYTRALHFQYAIYKHQAKKRGYDFNISKETFFELTESNECWYCGAEAIMLYKGKPYPLIGVDRIDNNGGYDAGNVAPCCRRCNVAKGTMSHMEFMEWIKRCYERWN